MSPKNRVAAAAWSLQTINDLDAKSRVVYDLLAKSDLKICQSTIYLQPTATLYDWKLSCAQRRVRGKLLAGNINCGDRMCPWDAGRELMCTVSFIPNSQGFYIGMNRDESVRRVTANSPEVSYRDGHALLYPAEPSGGTWIGVNDTGICLALINWHPVSSHPERPVVSRGTVVKTLIMSQSSDQLLPAIERLPLRRMPPFRLIAILLIERAVHELRWNQIEISQQRYEWEARHWFSSGFDEPAVQENRAKVCRTAWNQPRAGSLDWLRQLHASHSPAPGSFSICMHRKDAATVCYTEIVLRNGTVLMKYHHGPLCNGSTDFVERIIPLHERNDRLHNDH